MATVYDVLQALAKYDGSPNAHDMVIADCKKYAGKTVKSSDAWCSETVGAALAVAGGLSLTGGFQSSATELKKHAPKGTWHSGSSGIQTGDIVLYGSNGKPNHTEFAIGNDLNISGNYRGGCSRRKRSGRSIVGYIRPKYKTCPEFDNLQVTILACETILATYGSDKVREKNLAVFGKVNAQKIQDEVDRIWYSTDDTIFDLAVYVIAGWAGKDPYRRKRLGSFADSVQKKINQINDLRGKSVSGAAQDVLAGRYGTNAIRRLLLTFNGYDAQKVQDAVNEALRSPEKPPDGAPASIISLFRDADRKTKDVDGLQGDCIIIKKGKSALIMDTMRSGGMSKINAEIADCTDVWLYISHPHSDHMGANANTLVKSGKISCLLLPKRETVHKDYIKRYDTLVSDAKKAGVKVEYIGQGNVFALNGIMGKVLYQQTDSSTDSVNMRSLCTLITVNGRTYLTCGDHHCGTSESGFRYAHHVDIYKSSHHQLYTGDKEQFIRNISPDWIIGSGWKSWPLGMVDADPKVKVAQTAYQKVGNLLPGDVCGRTELIISSDGTITAKAERNMSGHAVRYSYKGETYTATVHTCTRTTYHAVSSMMPIGGKLL